jgi:hypothetical protein
MTKIKLIWFSGARKEQLGHHNRMEAEVNNEP